MNDSSKVSKSRTFAIAIALVLGILAGIFGQPWIHGNANATNVIVTSFSILAGFLIAIMTIIGDPSSFSARGLRFQDLAQNTIHRQLWRQTWLFVLYLATLCLIFAESLIEKDYPVASSWLERIFLGMAVVALVLSFRLPFTLKRIQMERHSEIIQARKTRSGVDNTSGGAA